MALALPPHTEVVDLRPVPAIVERFLDRRGSGWNLQHISTVLLRGPQRVEEEFVLEHMELRPSIAKSMVVDVEMVGPLAFKSAAGDFDFESGRGMTGWYDFVEGPGLNQGDIIPACPVLIAVELSGTQVIPKATMATQTVIVVTQTCDLLQNKTENVMVCAMWSVGQVVLQDPALRAKAEEACKKEKLGPLPDAVTATLDPDVERIIQKSGALRSHFNAIIKGERPAYAMLNDHPAAQFPRWIVSFQHVYAMPKGVVSRAAIDGGARLRLRSPYREHISAAFGAFFARIGLPQDIAQYKAKGSLVG